MRQPSPYHPDYGLTDELRREALRTADLVSVAVAASMYRVNQSTVYRWRKDYENLPTV
jgi:transposase-like protein